MGVVIKNYEEIVPRLEMCRKISSLFPRSIFVYTDIYPSICDADVGVKQYDVWERYVCSTSAEKIASPTVSEMASLILERGELGSLRVTFLKRGGQKLYLTREENSGLIKTQPVTIEHTSMEDAYASIVHWNIKNGFIRL